MGGVYTGDPTSFRRYMVLESLGGGPWHANDPEMAELLKEDQEMEGQARELVAAFRSEKDEQKRADLRTQLQDLTAKHFEVRQKRREREISRLEAQLERVRAAVTKRNANKDMIINRRLSQLLGEEDELAF